MRRLLPYAQLVRLPNTFTVWADILLGALATSIMLQKWQVLLCLLASSTLLYWSGMVWNDWFDLDEDRRDRPGRPLASGRVSLRTALFLALGLMVGGVLFACLADLLGAQYLRKPDIPPEQVNDAVEFVVRWRSLPVAAALVLAIFLYDAVLKNTWAGPVLMGSCRALNIILGLTILNALPPAWGWLLALVVGVYIAGVTWFARTEARESSQSMLIGAAIVIYGSFLLALMMVALALDTEPRFATSRFFVPLLALFAAYLGLAILRAIRLPEPAHVQTAVKRAILGLIVFDALLASAFVDSWGLLLALLLIPGVVLGKWLYST